MTVLRLETYEWVAVVVSSVRDRSSGVNIGAGLCERRRCMEEMEPKETQAGEPSEMALALGPDPFLKPERVQEFLTAWPDWTLGMGERALLRSRIFPNPAVASSYGAFVTRFAAARGLPVSIDVQGGTL